MTKNLKVYPKPNKPGFYWARLEGYGWYNLIVEICGEPPYLTYKSWDRGLREGLSQGSNPEFLFGPEITMPETESQ